MIPQRLDIGPRRLRWCKAQRRQPSRRIIDEHDQRHSRAAVFQPVMHAAVYLNELAEPIATLASLVHPLLAPPLGMPQREPNLCLPDCLHRDFEPLTLAKLLRRKGRTEVGVSFPQGTLHAGNRLGRQPVVRRLPASSRDQSSVAKPAIGQNQPLHLPHADPQQLNRPHLPHPPFRHLPDHMRPLALFRAHLQKVPVHRSPESLSAKKGTSQLCRKGTSELGAYSRGGDPGQSPNEPL